jgi:hypothetical protein
MNRLHAATLVVGLLAAAGCTGSAAVRGGVVYEYPVATVETVPAGIHYAPRVIYQDRYAYLVDDRWYYPAAGGWVVFRQEPRELRPYRVYYSGTRRSPVYTNRPGYRGVPPAYRQRDPDRYRYRDPAYGAPPAQPSQRRYYRPR